MPSNHSNWHSLISSLESQSHEFTSSYTFRNVYFLDDLTSPSEVPADVPPYMHILRHFYRSGNFSKPGYFIKSFISTDRVVIMHNHFPMKCLGPCKPFSVDTEEAYLAHYRKDCSLNSHKKCDEIYRVNPVRDEAVFRFKTDLVARTNVTLEESGVFSILVEQWSQDGLNSLSLPDRLFSPESLFLTDFLLFLTDSLLFLTDFHFQAFYVQALTKIIFWVWFLLKWQSFKWKKVNSSKNITSLTKKKEAFSPTKLTLNILWALQHFVSLVPCVQHSKSQWNFLVRNSFLIFGPTNHHLFFHEYSIFH